MRNIIILLPILFSISTKHTMALKPKEGFAGKNPFPSVENKIYFPQKIARWCVAPTINICRGNNIRKEEVKEAVSFLGESIVDVSYSVCSCEPQRGVIQVGRKCQVDNHEGSPDKVILGLTSIDVDGGSNCIRSAIVDVYDNEKLTLTHEIGHSFGWGHTVLPNHLMNPGDSSGWSTVGMD